MLETVQGKKNDKIDKIEKQAHISIAIAHEKLSCLYPLSYLLYPIQLPLSSFWIFPRQFLQHLQKELTL